MKIKLDENMPAALADSLRELGHDVHTVQSTADWPGCFLVLTERKLRIHRP